MIDREAYISRTLRFMEHIREQSYEAETEAERKRLEAEYQLLWESIKDEVHARPS